MIQSHLSGCKMSPWSIMGLYWFFKWISEAGWGIQQKMGIQIPYTHLENHSRNNSLSLAALLLRSSSTVHPLAQSHLLPQASRDSTSQKIAG